MKYLNLIWRHRFSILFSVFISFLQWHLIVIREYSQNSCCLEQVVKPIV